MRVSLCMFAPLLFFCMPPGVLGNPITAPTITVSVDGSPISFPLTVTDLGTEWLFNGTDALYSGTMFSGVLTLAGLLEPNPFLSYSFSATNASTQTHTYSVQFAVTPPAGTQYYMASSTYSGTIQDGPSQPGVTLGVPSGQTHLQTVSASPLGHLTNLDLGTTCTSLGNGLCGGGPAITTAFAPTTLTTLDLALSFTLTGGSDYASILGSATLIPVPEPGTWFLFACGLFLVAVPGLYQLLHAKNGHFFRH
ncbi:MAG: hypothetical protein M1541_03760 [Acidobacteria bacterium]|nr:hypothetical protein [Acidobacteriota bacterium]